MESTSRAGEAAYRILARELRTGILQNRYPSGTKLPTEADLARDHQVSRQTVRRAFYDLVAEGMVSRVPGRGTFAAVRDDQYLRQSGTIEDLMGPSLDAEIEVLRPLRRRVDIEAASRLRLDGDTVYSVVFRRTYRSEPLCHSVVHLNPSVGADLEGLPELTEVGRISGVTVIGLLDTRLTHPIVEAEQSITAAAASDVLAAALDCQPNDPLLRVDRIYITAANEYVELAINHFLPEHYSYRVKLRRDSL